MLPKADVLKVFKVDTIRLDDEEGGEGARPKAGQGESLKKPKVRPKGLD